MKFDAVIVGAGPAGVSCALWMKQLGFTPVLVDKQNRCGGLQLVNPHSNTWIATSVNHWGRDAANAMHQNMLDQCVELRLGQQATKAETKTDHITVDISNGERLSGRFLVLAGGVIPKSGGFSQRLGIVIGSGTPVTNTSVVGARVAILGGGDSAFENYKMAVDRGAQSVTIFARTLRARAHLVKMAHDKDVVVGEFSVNNDLNLVNGRHFDQIFVLFGYEAHSKSLLGLEPAMKTDGFVATSSECLTSLPLVYAIGEIAQRAHPCCVTSMADGVVAAKSIQRRIESNVLSKFTGAARRISTLTAKLIE